MKIPYMGVIGKKEIEEGTISIRKHTVGDTGSVDIDNAINLLKEEIELKK